MPGWHKTLADSSTTGQPADERLKVASWQKYRKCLPFQKTPKCGTLLLSLQSGAVHKSLTLHTHRSRGKGRVLRTQAASYTSAKPLVLPPSAWPALWVHHWEASNLHSSKTYDKDPARPYAFPISGIPKPFPQEWVFVLSKMHFSTSWSDQTLSQWGSSALWSKSKTQSTHPQMSGSILGLSNSWLISNIPLSHGTFT